MVSTVYTCLKNDVILSVRKHHCTLGPDYTLRTHTGVKLKNNRTQYSSPEMFWQCNLGIGPELH